MVDNSASFMAPIPGQSLTAELGSRPWQQPSRYNTVEEALEFYIPAFVDNKKRDAIYNMLEMGMPVIQVVNIYLSSGVMKGLHTVDVSMLLLPVLVEFISLMADYDGIEYTTGLEKEVDTDEIDPAMVAAVLRSYAKNGSTKMEESPKEEMAEETSEIAAPVKGLMARK